MRNMKDSGIEWIGEIPEDWNLRSIKSIIDNIKNEKNSSYDTKVLSLSINGVKIKQNLNEGMNPESYIGHQLVSEGDLVICLRDLDGPLLCGVSEYDGCLSNLYYVINFKDANAHFLDYLFHSMDYIDILDGFSYGMRHSYNISQFGCFNIPIPTIEEQELIVDYLDNKVKEIDNIISKTKEIIEEYKKYKQAVITEAVTKGLNPNVEMKYSGIEWNKNIPSHWNIINPRWIFTQRKDKAYEGDEQLTASQKHGVIYQKDFMEIENQKVVLVEKDFSILKHVEPNDFIISMRSFQGGLEYSKLRGCISSAYVMLIPNDQVYSPYFRWLFKSEKYINALQSTSNLVRDGQALRYSNFVQVPLFIFSKEEQKNIADYLNKKCEKIDKLIIKKENLIEELQDYKKSLIYECVTGKKEVSSAYAD